MTWAKQHSDKLDTAIFDLEANTAIMAELMKWLEKSEADLTEKNLQPMPTVIEDLNKYNK